MDRYHITFEAWDKVAAAYQDKFMDLQLYDDTYDTFCSLVEKSGPSIFEIGCGPGNITRYLLARRPDFKLEAIDVSPNMIELAKANNPGTGFRVMDCREMDSLSTRFDGIMCGFCLPYLSRNDCAALIKNCSRLLNRDGVLYISAIEGDYARSGYETGSTGHGMYVYYHGEEFLSETLEDNRLEVADIIRKPYPGKDGETSTHMILIARKR